VRKLAVAVPYLAPRLHFHACKCATLVTWEDERQPTQELWSGSVELARQAGAELVIFNGNRPTPVGFQGIN